MRVSSQSLFFAWGRLALLMGAGVVSSARAQSDINTPIGKLMGAASDIDFVEGFRNISIEERSELISLLTTEVAAWKSLAEISRVFLEHPETETSGLRPSLIAWLREAPAHKSQDLSHLKYLSLGQYPVETKVKLEKGECVANTSNWLKGLQFIHEGHAQGLAADRNLAPPSPPFLCTLKTNNPLFYYLLGAPYLMEKLAAFNPCAGFAINRQTASSDAAVLANLGSESKCNRELKISLAIDLIGDQGIFEELIVRSNTEKFIASFQEVDNWAWLRRKLWISLERLYTKLPGFVDSLPQRLRVAEISPTRLQEKEFIKKRKLAIFMNSALSEAGADTCSLLTKFYGKFSEQPVVGDGVLCPDLRSPLKMRSIASISRVELPVAAQVQGTAEAVQYHTSLRKIMGDALSWLQRSDDPQALAGSELFKEISLASAQGLTSELMAKMTTQIQQRGAVAFDYEGESARLVVDVLRDPVLKKNLISERQKLQALAQLWEQLNKALSKSVPVQNSERETLNAVIMNARTARALATELDRRL